MADCMSAGAIQSWWWSSSALVLFRCLECMSAAEIFFNINRGTRNERFIVSSFGGNVLANCSLFADITFLFMINAGNNCANSNKK